MTNVLSDSIHGRGDPKKTSSRPGDPRPHTAHDSGKSWSGQAVQLYNWNPARYANLTNHPKQYMKNYKKAEEMTKKIEAAYSLLSAVLVPDETPDPPS